MSVLKQLGLYSALRRRRFLLGYVLGPLLLFGFLWYRLSYPPIPLISSLPQEDNLILFSGSQWVFPTRMAEGLFVIDADTGEVWQLNLPSNIDWGNLFAWSPKEQLLLISGSTRDVEGNPEWNMYTITSSIEITRIQMESPSTFGGYGWLPDGSGATFSGSEAAAEFTWGRIDIYTQNINGSGLHRLIDMPTIDSWPSWAPTGEELVFEATDAQNGTSSIYKINSEGLELVNLTEHLGGVNEIPKWSPDGTKIAFLHADAIDQPLSLWVMSPRGGEQQQIFDTVDARGKGSVGGVNRYSWSPDSKRIAFASGHEGPCWTSDFLDATTTPCKERIYVINADGSKLSPLTSRSQPPHFDLAWIR